MADLKVDDLKAAMDHAYKEADRLLLKSHEARGAAEQLRALISHMEKPEEPEVLEVTPTDD